jgi:hypothetical protein
MIPIWIKMWISNPIQPIRQGILDKILIPVLYEKILSRYVDWLNLDVSGHILQVGQKIFKLSKNIQNIQRSPKLS